MTEGADKLVMEKLVEALMKIGVTIADICKAQTVLAELSRTSYRAARAACRDGEAGRDDRRSRRWREKLSAQLKGCWRFETNGRPSFRVLGWMSGCS